MCSWQRSVPATAANVLFGQGLQLLLLARVGAAAVSKPASQTVVFWQARSVDVVPGTAMNCRIAQLAMGLHWGAPTSGLNWLSAQALQVSRQERGNASQLLENHVIFCNTSQNEMRCFQMGKKYCWSHHRQQPSYRQMRSVVLVAATMVSSPTPQTVVLTQMRSALEVGAWRSY